ncbi:cyclic-phosphate processing receiver domain-containing protein [Aquisphaera giovannonii]|nr:cyclic-phosphate processing receiver domain-containing protein [Aquisphaera giovannonii]
MLEDDADRIRRFAAVLRRIAPESPLISWHDAHRMCREVGEHPPSARLISMDHDLDPKPGVPDDPGDGVIVARCLALQAQPCPVIIHSSNGTRSDWMAGEFELAGWSYRRVAPIGERWIEEYWRSVASELLGRAAASNRP